MTENTTFPPPGAAAELEEGTAFTPKFDADGLVTCVATDARSGEVLMVAHMNAEALAKTIATRRGAVLQPHAPRAVAEGRDSGHIQRVVEMRVDCDQDAVWIKVEQVGRRLPYRPALLLLPRGAGRQGRRGHARIPRRARL